MMLFVFLVLLLDLRSVAVTAGWPSGHTNKHVNQMNIRKAFSSLPLFLGLAEGFFVCFVSFFFKKE